MKILAATALILFFNQMKASESLIQVPEDCILNQESPCLVKARQSAVAEWNKIKIQFSKDSVIQLEKSNDKINVEIKQGFLILQSADKYKISGYEVNTLKQQFIKKNINEIHLLDSNNLDFKTLSFENQNPPQDKDLKNLASLVLQKSELLNREALVQYLSEFYTSKELLKKELASLSKQYQNRLNEDSKKQTEALQNHIHREIASEENVEKRRIAEQEKVLLERKRSRQLFFMRTFEQ